MRRLCTLIALTALAVPSTAFAQSGVTVDPNSPSGKEYAIPVDSARRQTDARPDGKKASGAPAPAPLFGEGVQPDRETEESAGGSKGGSGSGGSGGSGAVPESGTVDPAPSTSPPAAPEQVRQAADRAGESSGGSLSLLLVGVIAVLVCAGAAATGLALRRREGPTPA